MFLLDVKTFAGINRPAIVARQKIGGFYHISIGVRGSQKSPGSVMAPKEGLGKGGQPQDGPEFLGQRVLQRNTR
jgi:hypothetical protein